MRHPKNSAVRDGHRFQLDWWLILTIYSPCCCCLQCTMVLKTKRHFRKLVRSISIMTSWIGYFIAITQSLTRARFSGSLPCGCDGHDIAFNSFAIVVVWKCCYRILFYPGLPSIAYEAKMRTFKSTQPVAITHRMPALAASSSFFLFVPFVVAPFDASPLTGTSLTMLGAHRIQLTK
jgi:hypothetical protein